MTETITEDAGQTATDQTRHARALLARLSRGVPTPPLAELVTAHGPIEAAQTLRADPRAARIEYGVTITDGDDDRAAADLVAAAAVGARLLTPEDDGWPTGAVIVWHRPGETSPETVEVIGLWVRGPAALTGGQRLAMVGSRAATAYGTHVAQDWAASLTEAGVTVVTGGALGIDAAATRGVLAAHGTPVMVSPCGIDRTYPAAHQRLFESVAERGAIVSPYPPGQAPSRESMTGRLRLLAGLAPSGTLVIEAGARSAALRTARAAHEAGHPVLVVPGPVTSTVSAGTHQLAREPWARLVGSVDDVRVDIAPVRSQLAALVEGDMGDTLREMCAGLPGPTHISDDIEALAEQWHTARHVIVDEPGARQARAHGLAHRDGVIVVCPDDPPGTVWERAVAIGAEHVVSLPEGTDWLQTCINS